MRGSRAVPTGKTGGVVSRLDDAVFLYGEREYASDVRRRYDRYRQAGRGGLFLSRLARRGEVDLVFDGSEG